MNFLLCLLCALVLFCFVLFCFVLFCFVLFCFVLFCFVLFCFVLFCFVLFCFVSFCNTFHAPEGGPEGGSICWQVVEIGDDTIFFNFPYNFGGEKTHQHTKR